MLTLQYFEIYVTAAEYPLVVFMDHNSLTYLHQLKNKNQCLMKWSLMLQEYNFDVKQIKGPDNNIITDNLSQAG